MRLIDADALKYTMLYKENWLRGTGVEAPAVWKSDVDAMPTIDAVPVVQCRECSVPHNRWTGCPKLGGLIPPDDFYCAFGERKDGDGDA